MDKLDRKCGRAEKLHLKCGSLAGRKVTLHNGRAEKLNLEC